MIDDSIGKPLSRQFSEGPYYLDDVIVRREIAEDQVGIPTIFHIRVLAPDLSPIAGARFDIWQANAQGVYSGFSMQGDDETADTIGQTFLRGAQITDDDGVVEFTTIFPGWYRGRAPHAHGKIWLGDRAVHTTQLFFPDALSEIIYTASEPYLRAFTRDTLNATDMFFPSYGYGYVADFGDAGDCYVARHTLVIDPTAEAEGFKPRFTPPPGHRAARLPATPELPPAERARRLMPEPH